MPTIFPCTVDPLTMLFWFITQSLLRPVSMRVSAYGPLVVAGSLVYGFVITFGSFRDDKHECHLIRWVISG